MFNYEPDFVTAEGTSTRTVPDAAVPRALSAAIGDSGGAQQLIRTLPRRGLPIHWPRAGDRDP
jgi:hypothetical protein